MNRKTTLIDSAIDPAIQNLKSKIQNRYGWSRREFLSTAALAGTGALLGLPADSLAAEPPPEINKLRIVVTQRSSCSNAPFLMAEELLRGEGFTDLHYVQGTGGLGDEKLLTTGAGDFMAGFAGRHIFALDAGDPVVVVAGLHSGCYELFALDRIRSIGDLKGKLVAVTRLTSGRHIQLAIMLAHVGLDPLKDVNWVTDPAGVSIQRFAEGKIDAFMAFPLEPQELRAKKFGHVVVNTMMDKPWSQYFCCMVVANREFVRKHPVATKRALRAILQAAEGIPREPARAARLLVASGIAQRYDYALQTMKEIPYAKWRDYDPEDTVRFYGLRLHEGGMVRTSPHRIIAEGTDFRFIRELRRELRRSSG